MDSSTFSGEVEEVFHWCKLGYAQLHLHDHPRGAHPWACYASTTPHHNYTSGMETLKQEE